MFWSHEDVSVLQKKSLFKQSIDSNEDDKRNTSLGLTHSIPSRPHTRSQTGIVLKRRAPDDADFYAEQQKQATTSRKKPKKSVTSTDEQFDTRTQSSSSSSPKLPITRHPSLGSVSTSSRDPPNASQITFWHASPASDDQHELEARFPRSRATLPTPIPNLTKKSRGRRVPTQESSRTTTDQKATRLYICQVEGCGKCFHRGEHLKRHIRSIHTHEKPFQCSHPQCEKYFNRHDNLLQHLKVHREPHERPTLPSLSISPHRHLGEVQARASQRPESPLDEPESPASPTSPRIPYRQITSSYHAYSAPYSVPETSSRITNMAVSSLRTVLPHSPTENRTHSLSPRQYHC
ncbi:hypothetical protein BYT27DRAFT_7098105 [Phlegmacium glaucopus]|nr:hypothetical protein BYT27DRAFT_7098105 [Phlegmacium glaucopus]